MTLDMDVKYIVSVIRSPSLNEAIDKAKYDRLI